MKRYLFPESAWTKKWTCPRCAQEVASLRIGLSLVDVVRDPKSPILKGQPLAVRHGCK